MATVKLENITKRFGDLIALDDITLDIQDQEFFVLLGQTGAGKNDNAPLYRWLGQTGRRHNLFGCGQRQR